MHKKHLILITLIALIFILSSCKKSLIASHDIQIIELTPNKFLNSQTYSFAKSNDDKEIFNNITDFLETALKQPLTTTHQNYSDFTFDLIYKNNTCRTMSLDLDTKLQKAYLTEDDNTYELNSDLYNSVVNSDFLMPLMDINYNTPKLTLFKEGCNLAYIENSSYNCKYFNGTTKQVSLSTSDSVNALKINSGTAVNLHYSFNIKPESITENIYQNNTVIKTASLSDDKIILPSDEGSYTIELSCHWDNMDKNDFEGDAKYSFYIDNDLPVEFNVTKDTALPGDCFVVTAKNVNEGQSLSVTASFFNGEIPFIPYENYYVGIIPINAATSPGEYVVTASTTEPSTNKSVTKSFNVEVNNKYFDVQYLKVSADTYDLQSQENIDSDTAYLLEARSGLRPEKLWDGPFLQPVQGVVTTEYSEIRYTNDDPVPSRHSGIDLANKKGTKIMAANNGYVTMAMTLYLTGNTVVIDHGMGVFTAYCHLDNIDVAKGDYIKKGDIIGEMGTTGFSTGPHLHFTVYINGTYVNPWTFFDTDLLDF